MEYTNVKATEPRPSSGNDTVYRYEDDNGVVAYSSIRPATAEFDVIRFHCYACDPDSSVDWRKTPLFTSPYRNEIRTAAREFGVDPALVRAVIHAESAFNEKALSPVGAQGLMQLMPGTAKELGVVNALMAEQNIRGGVNYLPRCCSASTVTFGWLRRPTMPAPARSAATRAFRLTPKPKPTYIGSASCMSVTGPINPLAKGQPASH
ncbi:lytic transglycosylase domain-containing protein [Marinobacter similis]